jgi:bacillithiol biosynthesis cysteine-adding enzyme BshC
MKADCELLPFHETGFFSKLVVDYLRQEESLRPFYRYAPSFEGIEAAIIARQQFKQDRKLLHDALLEQYASLEISGPLENHIRLLQQPTTFTITTAHQPNILTGPLYFIYKILHAIKLAAECKNRFTQFDFVPVYYMGSEDADLDELGHIFLNGEKLEWKTEQGGAVGRMNPKGIERLIERLEGEFGSLPYGKEMVALCKTAYLSHNTIQQATLYLVNELFKDYGLVVIIPDNARLKSTFAEVVKKELTTQFSYPLVKETTDKIEEQYKVQAAGRELNLFYLGDDGSRERIEVRQQKHEQQNDLRDENEKEFVVVNKDISFTREAILIELDEHPERFSANVILRGVFQETVLPNIAFIGGGGELAYWMELKKVFEAAQVPYPVLLLRNSFLLVFPKSKVLMDKLRLSNKQLFQSGDSLVNDLVLSNSPVRLDTKKEQQDTYKLYEQLQELASSIDTTLKAHIAALHVRSLQGLLGLEKKLLRAEKRKHAEIIGQVQKLKTALFPNNNLQERVDNFMPLYATHGKALIDLLYQHSQPVAEAFTTLFVQED